MVSDAAHQSARGSGRRATFRREPLPQAPGLAVGPFRFREAHGDDRSSLLRAKRQRRS